METSVAIYTKGLDKSYGSVKALQGVDLEVKRGEIFGFLGPNGAGKTTTIRCLLDLIRPDSGTLRVLGIDPQVDPVAVRNRVGYLPGELHLDENMTAAESFRYFLRLRHQESERWPDVVELVEQLELDPDTKIKNLSKGNKQKVGVVQALMHRPDVLMMDEPTSGLDPLVQRTVLGLLRQASDAGATVFFSSHILSEVQAIADRIGIIRKGVVIEVAETEQFIQRALHRAHVRFTQTVDYQRLADVPGVDILNGNGNHVSVQIEGHMDQLIKTLAEFPVQSFETERPSLEEIFLAYYE